ncbi:hypothetical protein BT96DRAFT_1022388 [Gymnopus androsaceus JB14]|uniref:Uncharacterized protein n=1 Tax=Gymnopus androsaceus JB14 TaxID=1447944 RepID=A0A6A4HCD2_9AGAR|nr:hypothetical protein BT96DRAFT_1022388 [Gymnopus androsaceus JB14]
MMNAQQLARKEAKKRQENKKEDLATPDSTSPPLSFPQSSGSPEPSQNRSPSPEISPPPEMAKPSKLPPLSLTSQKLIQMMKIAKGEDSEGEDSEDEDDEDGDPDEDSDSDKVISKVQKTKVLAPLVIRLKPKKKGSTKQGKLFSTLTALVMQMKLYTSPQPISWSDFEHALANALGIAPKSIQVAYRFSTSPQTSSFHHVRDASELAELVKDAEVAEDGLAKSRAQMKKKFVVLLKHTGEQSEKDKKAKAKAKAKGKAKMGKNKHKRAQQSDSDSSDNDDGKQKPKKKKMGQAQWITQITADNQCLEHKCVCLKSIASHLLLKNHSAGLIIKRLKFIPKKMK